MQDSLQQQYHLSNVKYPLTSCITYALFMGNLSLTKNDSDPVITFSQQGKQLRFSSC